MRRLCLDRNQTVDFRRSFYRPPASGNFSSSRPSNFSLSAGELRLNGEALPESNDFTLEALSTSDVLSGTFSDGTTFIFSGSDGDQLSTPIAIQPIAIAAPDSSPIMLNDTSDQSPQSLRNGQTLTLSGTCLLYTSPSPRDRTRSRMPSSA